MIFQPASNIQVPFMQPQWRRGRAAAGGGSGAAFSDDFSGTLANWTEDAGDIVISGGRLSVNTGGYSKISARYTGTSTNTVNQYVKLSFPAFVDTNFPFVILRGSASGNPYYAVEFARSNAAQWYRYANAADSSPVAVSASTSLTVSAGDTFGLTITGTGTATVIRIWRNPTGLPSAADNWNGDTTPEITWTDDPASAVNTGNQVGFGGFFGAAGQVQVDDFFGGDIP